MYYYLNVHFQCQRVKIGIRRPTLRFTGAYKYCDPKLHHATFRGDFTGFLYRNLAVLINFLWRVPISCR